MDKTEKQQSIQKILKYSFGVITIIQFTTTDAYAWAVIGPCGSST